MDTNAYVDNLVDTLANGQFVDVAGRPRSPYFNNSTFIASPIISDDAVLWKIRITPFTLIRNFS